MPEARPPWGDPPAHCRAGASRWGRICGFALPGASECERLPRLADGCMSDRATIRIAARFEEDAWRQSKATIFRGWAQDRKRVVTGKRVSVRVDLGGCRIIKKQINRLIATFYAA